MQNNRNGPCLYPTLLIFLRQKLELTVPDITVYSTKQCPHCNNLKAWLAQNNISYHAIDVVEDADAACEMIDLTGQRGVPVIIIDGEVFVGFDRPRIEARLSIDNGKEISADHALIVIGSGAAGLAAAMYAGRKGIETLVIGDARGGMTTRSSEIENYPGFYRISGASLMRLFADQAEGAGAVILDDVVTDFSVQSGLFFVETLSSRAFTAKAVIAASGRTPKLSGVPGEAELFGKGVSVCTTCDGLFFKGKQVAVYDGGNTAADMALEMSDIASVVYLISRSPLKADAVTIDHFKEKKNVVIETGVVITGLHGDRVLSAIDTAPRHDPANTTRLAIDGLFLGLGLTPNTAVFAGTVGMNTFGEILVTRTAEQTSPDCLPQGMRPLLRVNSSALPWGTGSKLRLPRMRTCENRSPYPGDMFLYGIRTYQYKTRFVHHAPTSHPV